MARIRIIGTCLGFWILIGILGTGLPVEARQNDRELLESGRACQTDLFATPKKQAHRIYWKKCIEPFEQLIEWYPQSPQVDESLFILGGLYRGLSGFSGSTDDRDRAVSYYRRLLVDRPDSPLAKRTRSRLQAISPGDISAPVSNNSAVIENVRFWDYPDYTRLVFDLDRPFEYRRSDPDDSGAVRLTLDHTTLSSEAQSQLAAINEGLLKGVAVKPVDGTAVELFISQNGAIQSQKIIRLDHPDRLVIDLFKSETASPAPRIAVPPAVNVPSPPPVNTVRTIIIDPGHGGKDPGAIGKSGLMEKDVVLDIGLRLRRLIKARLGKTVVMTRDSDVFIELSDRTAVGNSEKADLFISIHANSHPKQATRGVEIYFLGQSSDRHALSVAARENSVSLESAGDLDRSVQNILLDLGLEYKINQSLEVAAATRQSFQTILVKQFQFEVSDLRVKQAPFYVLLNSKMPGILAEVSYISNPTEEKLLKKERYRQALAETLFEGVKQYIAALESTS